MAPWNKGKKMIHSGSFKKGHPQSNTGKTHFKKGRISENKGKKLLCISGYKNHNWKGGTYKHSSGYIMLSRPNHSRARKRGYVNRSILIAEVILDRKLNNKEIIHHIDGNKTNDNPDNLYLFSSNSTHISYHMLKNKPLLKSNLTTQLQS